MSTTPSALTRVLSLPDLLEPILLCLPPRDLLLAQLISRHFHSLITNSPLIQPALFFRPAPSKPNTTPTTNPLLAEHFPHFFTVHEDARRSWQLPSFEKLMRMPWISSLQTSTVSRTQTPFLRREASWRRMLLMQPPPRDLHLLLQACSRREFLSTAKLPFAESEAGGVTMDVVYDIVVSFVTVEMASGFSLIFESAEEGTPKLTLRLTYTVQCIMGSRERTRKTRRGILESEGQGLVYEDLEDKWVRVEVED
ncbi:hypothetical protein M011DRAFT_524452 [Sporormia fimetaria CBS 119925]|uniref:F-box domain-containing protein n=1 Tax=Sporormia fimetaria CBS 119925 TaxID=1340428 RepID=A0A6A6VJA9_9PLEO|nr:hypothetical protein M011DRAFT_524452 [Sporormia fimetaria CBS 119925]